MTKDQVRSTEEALSLEQTLRLALEALEGNRRTHHYCEDTWYSCPKHEDGCANDSESDECNCGADKANAGIDQAIIAIKAALEAKDEPVAGQPLPCPFCGHVGLNFADGETYRWGVASCGGCGASCGDIRREYPDLGEWHTEAIAEWNRRSPAPQRPSRSDITWVGLTDEEIHQIFIANSVAVDNGNAYMVAGLRTVNITRAIEAKLKEKNT